MQRAAANAERIPPPGEGRTISDVTAAATGVGWQKVSWGHRLAAMLTTEELERYARHIVLREIGGPGQQKLKQARVLVIGAGGLGAPVLMYLAAAGIGTLGIADDDKVTLSNLQRQVIFKTADTGKS